jgi:hypothetical protein
MPQSEVVRLRRQIELECEAMRLALYGYAAVASHESINHRYDALAVHQTELEKYVGKEEATRIIYETYEKAIGKDGTPTIEAEAEVSPILVRRSREGGC